ncbi:MAG: HD domain-containing phosphohydrolase [Lachnospiraceae bacterium]|jgi:putative two-component system response regulator|nr:HD domain-containing phosphohydrolase [Lachnospiraceae bacterium]MEE3461064.1 HD domain-containing phosphohydrolase [Lachnospiraceae bacterium]
MNNKILIIDTEVLNRNLLDRILGRTYEIDFASSGEEAIEKLGNFKDGYSLVILNLILGGVSGYDILDYMRLHNILEKTPVLVALMRNMQESERHCAALGATDFIYFPFDAALVSRKVALVSGFSPAVLVSEETKSKGRESKKEGSSSGSLTGEAAKELKSLREENAELKNADKVWDNKNRNLIELIGTIAETRDLENPMHIKRIKKLTRILADEYVKDYPEYGLNDHAAMLISEAAALHDIGKISIPDSILLKPGKLDDDEFDFIKSHTLRGCELIESIKDAWSPEYGHFAYEICRNHHERYDGHGYPDHLSGDNIPVSAQLESIADVYEALTHDRCYKDKVSPEIAYDMIINGECGVFSPKLIEAFRKTRVQFEAAVTDEG